jgi:mRNA interferase HicA
MCPIDEAHNSIVDNTTELLHYTTWPMTSQEFKRCLQRQGCTFDPDPDPGHGGHLIVRLASRFSVLPMHGKQKELGTGLVNRIRRDLGLK